LAGRPGLGLPTVTQRRHRIAAVCLALMGQLVGIVGMPTVAGHYPDVDEPVTPCGCSVADRDAGRCCCSKPEPVSCCAPEPIAEPEPQSCCDAHKETKRPKARLNTTKVHWVNAALRQKCLGDIPASPGQPLDAGVAPDRPAAWAYELVPAGWFTISDRSLLTRVVPPDEPPPRPL